MSDTKCDKCNGSGYQKDEYKVTMNTPSGGEYTMGYSRTCLKCHGTGKLDWIETVVGKKIEDLKHDQLLEFSRLN
jgi:DnaJ-class molecular chaperone